MYDLLRTCHTLVPKICICPEMMHVFQYIYVVHVQQQGPELHVLISAATNRLSTKTGR